MRAMDDWLQQGMRFASGRPVSGAERVTPPCSFYFSPRRMEQALVGVLQPSRDSVGRTYPLLVALEMDGARFDGRQLSQVPLRFNAFFEKALALTQEAAAGHLDRQALGKNTEGLRILIKGEESNAFYGRYLQQTTLASFWERLWGHPQDSRKYLLFKNLLDIVLPLRSGVPPGFPLVLRFPLCPDIATLDFDTSFWLGMTLRLLGYPDIAPTLFWTHPQEGGRAPFLLLALQPQGPKMFSYLVSDRAESDDLCVLETMGSGNAALAALSIPDRYGRLLEDDDLTLWDFLKRF